MSDADDIILSQIGAILSVLVTNVNQLIDKSPIKSTGTSNNLRAK